MGKFVTDKKIESYDQLESFVIATINAIPEVSKVEAQDAIKKAFTEFRTSFDKAWRNIDLLD